MSEGILYLRSSRRCTGLERRVALVAATARDAGFAPHLAVLHRRAGVDEHPLLDYARARGLPATFIEDPAPLSPTPLFALAALIRQLQPAIIHTQDYRSNLLALAARRLAGSPARLLASCHGHTAAGPAVRLYEYLDRRVLRAFNCVLGFSAYQCQMLRQWGVNAGRIVHIPHFIEPGWADEMPATAGALQRRRWGFTDEDFLVGFFGRASPEKGLDTLLTAFAQARAAEPRARLVIAGDGLAPHFSAPAVLYLGFLDDVRPAMLACDLIAVPSRREAFGLTALEAVALGRPVLASAVGGLLELVRHGETGWLAPAGDVAAWVTALLRLLGDAPLRHGLAERGRADVLARFPVCQISQAMIALYRQLLGMLDGELGAWTEEPPSHISC